MAGSADSSEGTPASAESLGAHSTSFVQAENETVEGYGTATDTDAASITSAITPATQDDLDDEGYGTSDASSYMSSILSSVRRGVQENGRVYPSFGKYEYGIPIDEEEMDRNDLQHHKFFLLLDHKLYLAPIPDSVFEEPGSRILDVGTGTGVWAIDMADKFPNAEIVGNDIAATQPSFVPPNCIFEIEDCEDDWPYPSQSFDYIHVRELLYALRDYPRLIAQAYNATRPGGWLELAMTVPDVHSDDDSLPPNSAIKEAGDVFLEIGEKMGSPPTAARLWNRQLVDAGFINVQTVVLKIPTSPWPKEKRLRHVGAMERFMLSEGLHSMILRGWTQILGRNLDDLTLFVALANRELRDPKNIHPYCTFQITYGQKPEA